MEVSRSARLRATGRLLLLQAAWNYDRLQNIGFAFCVEPALRELYPDPGTRLDAMRRHLELFNTHPYMAGYVLGAALRTETEAAEGKAGSDRVSTLKMALAPALAALGDSFFWATLRPAAVVVAVAWLWLAPHPWQLAAPALFLVLYNGPCLWLRYHSVEVGWQRRDLLAQHVAGLRLPAASEGLRAGAMVMLGGLAGLLGRAMHPATGAPVPLVNNFLFLGAGLAMLMLLRLAVRPIVLLALCVAASLTLALVIPT